MGLVIIPALLIIAAILYWLISFLPQPIKRGVHAIIIFLFALDLIAYIYAKIFVFSYSSNSIPVPLEELYIDENRLGIQDQGDGILFSQYIYELSDSKLKIIYLKTSNFKAKANNLRLDSPSIIYNMKPGTIYKFSLANSTCPEIKKYANLRICIQQDVDEELLKNVPESYKNEIIPHNQWPIHSLSYTSLRSKNGQLRTRYCAGFSGGLWWVVWSEIQYNFIDQTLNPKRWSLNETCYKRNFTRAVLR